MILYADLQFFKVGGQFVVKEFAVLSYDSEIKHYVFKPPMNFKNLTRSEKKEVKWVERHHHQILWNTGYVPCNYAKKIIVEDLQCTGKVFVKGLHKVNYLQTLNINAYNIEDSEDIPKCKTSSFTRKISCMNHEGYSYICALSNVFNIKNLVEKFLL